MSDAEPVMVPEWVCLLIGRLMLELEHEKQKARGPEKVNDDDDA